MTMNSGEMSDEMLEKQMDQEMMAKIVEHIQVRGSDNDHVGTVDHLDGQSHIKLTKSSAPDGQHHWIPIDWVQSVDDVAVYINRSGEDARSQWLTQGPGGA